MKSKSLNGLVLVFSIAVVLYAIFIMDDSTSANGVIAGIFGGLFGLTLSNLFSIYYYEKHPVESRIAEIEEKDERNISIRNRAKARSGDIMQWFIIGIGYINIAIDGPLWFTLIIVGVFLLRTVLYFLFLNRYQKEM